MNPRFFSVCVCAAVAVGTGTRASASVEPLVVVVEVGPGSDVDAVEVRRTIAAELRTPVRAPRDAAGEEASDLLIVAVDRAEIRMSLRPRSTGGFTRAVVAPGDRKERLRSIGWLAGNLARDQVSPIVASLPAAPVAVSVEVEPASRPDVPPAPPRATEPPPLPENELRQLTPEPSGVVVARPSPAAGGAVPMWSLTLGGGPSAVWAGREDRVQPFWPGPGIWYLEVQRRASADGLILGAVLDVGPDMAMGIRSGSLDFMGGAALVGVGRRFGRTFVEATGGLGLEAYQSTAVVLGLYLRGQGTAGLALSRSFDLLASVGGHLGSVGRMDQFLTGSLALRCRFSR